MYLEPIVEEGFLETTRTTQVVSMETRGQQQRVLIFQEQTVWMTQEHVEFAPLVHEVLEGTDSEKIWHEWF